MKSIFLIYDNESDYESHPNVIGFKFTKEEAEKHVEELVIAYNVKLDWQKQICAAKLQFISLFPQPEYEKIVEAPRWESGLGADKITTEMKNERTKVGLLNKGITERNAVKEQEYEARQISGVISGLEIPEEIMKELNEQLHFEYGSLSMQEDRPYFYAETFEL